MEEMKKIPKIPFPTMGKKIENEKEKTGDPVEEYIEQQKEIEKDEESFFKEKFILKCQHEISLAVFVKTGLMLCGNCKKAMYIQRDGWIDTNIEYPKEWEQQ